MNFPLLKIVHTDLQTKTKEQCTDISKLKINAVNLPNIQVIVQEKLQDCQLNE